MPEAEPNTPASYHIIIPARMDSNRLPGKMLAEVDGRPLILHTLDQARRSHAASVHVATDSQRIADVVNAADGHAIMTDRDHASGTDRLVEAVAELQLADDAIVVNLQGDEPEMPAQCLQQVADLLACQSSAQMSTLWSAITDQAAWQDPNVVKVLSDHSGRALYFSRAGIPHVRSGSWPGENGGHNKHAKKQARRHIGLYAYRTSALRAWPKLPASPLEQLESLEQLRALQAGWQIATAQAIKPVPGGIDTPADLQKFRQKLAP